MSTSSFPSSPSSLRVRTPAKASPAAFIPQTCSPLRVFEAQAQLQIRAAQSNTGHLLEDRFILEASREAFHYEKAGLRVKDSGKSFAGSVFKKEISAAQNINNNNNNANSRNGAFGKPSDLNHRQAFKAIGGLNCPLLTTYAQSYKGGVCASGIGSRNVPSAPERVLDAPGMMDDFYLNLLDWGKRNILGVGLASSVYLWSGRDASVHELMTLPDGSGPIDPYISSLRWIHDGTSMGIGTSEGQVQIWDIEAGKRIRTILASAEGHRIGSLAWNKHLLSTGSRSGKVLTHDVRLAKPLIIRHESLHTQEICGLEWSPDGKQLASGANDNLVHLWDVDSGTPRHVLTEHKSAVKAIAWCPWKPGLLATGGGSQDRQIRTWNAIAGECLSTVHAGSTVSSLVWSRTSRELVSAHGHSRNHVRFWKQKPSSTSPCQLMAAADIEEAHQSRILHMTLSPDGQTLVSAGADESIKFWKAFEREDEMPTVSGKQRKTNVKTLAASSGYVLMPTFSRSSAVSKALNMSNISC